MIGAVMESQHVSLMLLKYVNLIESFGGLLIFGKKKSEQIEKPTEKPTPAYLRGLSLQSYRR